MSGKRRWERGWGWICCLFRWVRSGGETREEEKKNINKERGKGNRKEKGKGGRGKGGRTLVLKREGSVFFLSESPFCFDLGFFEKKRGE